MSDKCAEVPSFIPGRVVGIIDADICMDGARYLFAPSHPHVGHLRIKPLNESANQKLEEAYESREEVVVGGYPCTGPECFRFDCYVVIPAQSFAEKAANF